MDRVALHGELDEVETAFHRLVSEANDTDLRRPSEGTRWTNKQLLFHMLLGYLILRALRLLVLAFVRLPDQVSRTYARLLNAGTRPFGPLGPVLHRLQILADVYHFATRHFEFHRRQLTLNAPTE